MFDMTRPRAWDTNQHGICMDGMTDEEACNCKYLARCEMGSDLLILSVLDMNCVHKDGLCPDCLWGHSAELQQLGWLSLVTFPVSS